MVEETRHQHSLLPEKFPKADEFVNGQFLANKHLLIVSATGGIGRAVFDVADYFGSLIDITVSYNRPENEAVARRMIAESGRGDGDGRVFQYTHGTAEAAQEFVGQLPSGIDYVIDASGLPVSAGIGSLVKNPMHIEDAFRVNALGPFYLFVHLINSRKLRVGAQLAYTSTLAVGGNPGQSPYAASKAGMVPAMASWSSDPLVVEQKLGLKSLVLSLVETDNKDAKLALWLIERAERSGVVIKKPMRDAGYLMTPLEAAYQMLAATVNPAQLGSVPIPAGATLEKLRSFLPAQH